MHQYAKKVFKAFFCVQPCLSLGLSFFDFLTVGPAKFPCFIYFLFLWLSACPVVSAVFYIWQSSVCLLTHLQGVLFYESHSPSVLLSVCVYVSLEVTSVSGHRQLFRCHICTLASLSFNDGSHPSTLPPPSNFT